MTKGTADRTTWTVTTHDWSVDVDRDHLTVAREAAESLGHALSLHLVLEVLASADDEAAAIGRRGTVHVSLTGAEIEVADDGRGTDTRHDAEGRAVRNPVMATRDVRFFDSEDSPLLPDGLQRRGISLVAAASPLLLHENRRIDGSWAQAYGHGIPWVSCGKGRLLSRPGRRTFQLPSSQSVDATKLCALAEAFEHINVLVRD